MGYHCDLGKWHSTYKVDKRCSYARNMCAKRVHGLGRGVSREAVRQSKYRPWRPDINSFALGSIIRHRRRRVLTPRGTLYEPTLLEPSICVCLFMPLTSLLVR